MLGAIIGDLAGSIYEFGQLKKVRNIKVNNIIEENSFISDDTILTMAILKAVLTDKDYNASLKKFGLKYESMLPDVKPYFKTVFSPNFSLWLHGNFEGKSAGNGAMMRISPIGFLFDNEEDVILNAKLATIPSHDTNEAIDSAILVARIIFWAKQGLTKSQIIKKLNIKIIETKLTTFNYTCKDTVGVCLYSLFTSNSFEESIIKIISYGGDTDTNACIVGSMAEALFGIPDKLKEKAKNFLPKEFIELLKIAYDKIDKKQT